MADFYYKKQIVTSFLTKENCILGQNRLQKVILKCFKNQLILAKNLNFPQKLLNLLFLNWAVRPIWKPNLRIRV